MKTTSAFVQKILVALRKEITNGILKPGTHLTEKSISKKFNVSRVPVREAFRILQSEGYIELILNRGSFVKSISKNNIIENGDIYLLLAPLILKKAIPNYTKHTYKKAHSILDKVENSSEYYESSYLVWEFAKVIYSPAKMEQSMKIINDIYCQSIRVLNDFFEKEEFTKIKIDTHRKFLVLCEENKQDEAIELWMELIEFMKQNILNNIVDKPVLV